MGKYWLSEEPKIIDLNGRQIRDFEKAEKIQFCTTYTDDEGQKKPGKVVSLSYEVFLLPEVQELFKKLMEV